MTLAATQDLAPYVPRLATELADRDGASWTSIEGSMLSADISGFTALSEKLAGKGKAGAEEITSLINTCFTALIGAAYDYRGEVIKFGGDALLVLFRGPDHERRCANASLAMQIALHSSPAAKRANLTMTVGASHGPFDVFMAGSGYRELLVIGPAASNVIHLEGEADKGETLLSPTIAAHVPSRMLGREHAGGLAVAGDPFDPPMAAAARPWLGDDLSPFVPPQVVEQLAAFAELGGEHRIVSVGFVLVSGVGAQLETVGPQGTADALSHLVDGIVAATAPYGVTALHTDIADDGFKVVLCAGAPVNPGDTSDALLQAALDIAAIDTPFVLRQGCQTGRVFAGFLGSPYRRTYTLMGDPVNTAARMLGKAGDRDIVAVGTMVDDTRTIFASDELEPFHVKGKVEPIVAHRIRGATDEVRRGASATRLHGREKELAILASAIGELGEVVDIVGPAGVGKSRLLDAAWDEAEGMRFFRGACTPYGATSPYSVFRPLLRNGIGIDVNADPAEAGRLLQAFVAEAAPDLLPMLPLIAVPFGAEVASTPEADAIDAEFRRQRIHESIVALYDTTLGATPVFLVIEDLHWVDDASADLTNQLIRAAASRPWTGVVTRRPQGAWEPEESADHVTTIDLQPLTDDDIRRLAIDASEHALSDAQLATIAERANGNPLFAIELARAASSSDGLPESIEGVITTRIDALAPTARMMMRVAAVLGKDFVLPELTAVGRFEDLSPDRVVAEAGGMVEKTGEESFTFTHAMYRDVAYEGLPFGRRRQLHLDVGEYLEQRAEDPAALAPLLSVHFSEAQAHAKSWQYSRLAGDQATLQFAHTEAAKAYARALRAAVRLRTVPEIERCDVAEAMGDALLTTGDYEGAFDAFGRARRDADHLRETDLMCRQGVVRSRQGSTGTATRWYQRCLARVPATGGTPAERRVRMNVDLAFAAARHRQGRFPECLEWAERAAEDARLLDDKASLAKALDRLHVAATYLGLDDADRYGPEALALHRELGDHLSQARILDNMGIQAYFGYDWDRALELYGQASEAGAIAGDVIEANLARMNAAEVHSDRGAFALAEEEFRDVLRNWTAAGWTFGVAAARSNLGLALARGGGDPTESIEELTGALDSFVEMSAEEFIPEVRVRLVEASVHLGDPASARHHAELARSDVQGDQLHARLDRQVAMALLLDGERARGMQMLRGSLDRAAAADAIYEVALSTAALALCDVEDPQLQADSDRLLGELRIERLPMAYQRLRAERQPGTSSS